MEDRQVPWHGVGIPGNVVREKLQAGEAIFDWDVEIRSAYQLYEDNTFVELPDVSLVTLLAPGTPHHEETLRTGNGATVLEMGPNAFVEWVAGSSGRIEMASTGRDHRTMLVVVEMGERDGVAWYLIYWMEFGAAWPTRIEVVPVDSELTTVLQVTLPIYSPFLQLKRMRKPIPKERELTRSVDWFRSYAEEFKMVSHDLRAQRVDEQWAIWLAEEVLPIDNETPRAEYHRTKNRQSLIANILKETGDERNRWNALRRTAEWVEWMHQPGPGRPTDYPDHLRHMIECFDQSRPHQRLRMRALGLILRGEKGSFSSWPGEERLTRR